MNKEQNVLFDKIRTIDLHPFEIDMSGLEEISLVNDKSSSNDNLQGKRES